MTHGRRADDPEPTVRLDVDEPTMALPDAEPTVALPDAEPTITMGVAEYPTGFADPEPTLTLPEATAPVHGVDPDPTRPLPEYAPPAPKPEYRPPAPRPEYRPSPLPPPRPRYGVPGAPPPFPGLRAESDASPSPDSARPAGYRGPAPAWPAWQPPTVEPPAPAPTWPPLQPSAVGFGGHVPGWAAWPSPTVAPWPARQPTAWYGRPQPAHQRVPPFPVGMSGGVGHKSVGLAYLLWFFAGGFGLHQFYLGRTGWGIAYLLMLLGSPFTLFASLFPLAICLLVDMLLIPAYAAQANRRRDPGRDRSRWV